MAHMMTSKKQAARVAPTGLRGRQNRDSTALLGGQVPPHLVFWGSLYAVIMSVMWVSSGCVSLAAPAQTIRSDKLG